MPLAGGLLVAWKTLVVSQQWQATMVSQPTASPNDSLYKWFLSQKQALLFFQQKKAPMVYQYQEAPITFIKSHSTLRHGNMK